jgi:hypothetical protein
MSSDNTEPPRHQDIVINVGGGDMLKRSSTIIGGAQDMPAAIAPPPRTSTAQQAAVAGHAVRALITPRNSRANIIAKLLGACTIILAFGSGFFSSQYMSFGAGVTGTFMIMLQEFVASSR